VAGKLDKQGRIHRLRKLEDPVQEEDLLILYLTPHVERGRRQAASSLAASHWEIGQIPNRPMIFPHLD
jgi:hypothetical protein